MDVWIGLVLASVIFLILIGSDWMMWSVLFWDAHESKERERWEKEGRSVEYILYSMVVAALSVLAILFISYLGG